MSSEPDDEQARAQKREAHIADMKSRMEQIQASGQSPEQIREQVAALAHEEMQRQMPEIIAKTRSWWSGFRNFLIVGVLALGVAVGFALFVEHRYAAPLCEHYAAQHGLTYKGYYYPVIGRGSSTTSASGSCIFVNSTGHQNTVSLKKTEPDWATALLVGFALQIEVTTPVAFVLIALIAVSLRKRKRLTKE